MYAQQTFLYDVILKIKAGYTDDLQKRDQIQFEELSKMAEEDAVDPNNYYNTMMREQKKTHNCHEWNGR